MTTWQPIRLTFAVLMAAALLAPVAGRAEEPGKDAKASKAPAEKPKTDEVALSPLDQPMMIASNMPLFVSQNRGAPMARLGGATRSAGKPVYPRMEALVPEQPGWTLEAQPTLYWYISEVPKAPVEFTLMRVDPHASVVETTLPAPTRAGVQRIALADYGASLETGASYQWLVKLVPNREDRSYDQIIGGGIERVEANDELLRKLSAPGASRPHVLAQAGIWYDAVDGFSRAIDASPRNTTLVEQRAALLDQVGLPSLVAAAPKR